MKLFFSLWRRRFRRWFQLPIGLVLVLAGLAAANLGKVGQRPFGPDRPADFRPVYVGQWALRHGLDPYRDQSIRQGWRQLVADEHLASTSEPGLPEQAFIYPPWAAAFVGGLVGGLPYGTAWPLWYGGVLLSLLTLCYATRQALRYLQAPPLTLPDLLLTALALKGTVVALLNGQSTFLALALASGAWWAGEARRPWLAGLLLGAAAFKITVALPFIGYFLLGRRWRSLAAASAAGAALLALYWHWAADPWAQLASYRQLLAWVQYDAVRPDQPRYPLGRAMLLQFELANWLEFLHPGGHRWAGLGAGLLGVLSLGRLAWLRRHRTADPLLTLLVLHLLGLLFTYHVVYDALLLLPLLGYARALPGRAQLGLLALAAPFFLPVNGLLDRLGSPPLLHGLYFTLPLGALALLLALLWLGPRPAAPKPAGVA